MVSKLLKTPRHGHKQSNKKAKKLATKKSTSVRLTVSDEQGNGTPERSTVFEFINALCKVHKQKKSVDVKLFEEDGNGVHLQVAGIKLPKDNRNQLIRCVLPHCAVPDPVDICLFVKDLQKGLKVDHEPTLEHFNSILEEKDAKCLIGQVVSLRELKVEYKQYEARRLLSNKFDVFLADARIIRLLPKFLGKAFYSRKRFPVQVDLNKRNLREELEKAIRTVTLPLSHHGTTATLRVGHIGMEREELVDNVMHAVTLLSKRYPGGWKNVRSLHVKTESSMAIPIHVCTTSANDVGFVDSDAPIKIKQRTVTGEFSLIPGAEVTVTPAGKVTVKRAMDSTWNDEQVEDDEPFVDGSDIEEEEDETEAEKNDDERTKKRSRKGESKTTQSPKKKKRNVKPREQDSSDSEDDIRSREMSYLRSAQREEWQDGKSEDPETTRQEEEEENIEEDRDEIEESGEDDDAAEEDSDEEQEDSDDVPESNEGASDNESDQQSSEGEYDDQQPLDEQDVVVDSDDDDGSEADMDSLMFQPATDGVEGTKAEINNPRTKKKTKNERRKDRNKQKAACDTAGAKRMGVGNPAVHAVPTKKRNRKRNM